ncbi:MAG: DUF5856 family protein [Fusobacteriaceae bacterium]|uniref:DUF5856 family protein n=1 Tax=Romboutsia sp. TaxID=1965302 RepID=UPI003F2CA02A
MSIIDEIKKSNNDIPSLLFKAQIDAKITHLLQKDRTYARHEAMSIFYDKIGDLIDTFVETYKGIKPLEEICTKGSCCIENPTDYFQNLYNTIETLRKPIKETFLQNQIDEIQSLISHTLYRLKFITT